MKKATIIYLNNCMYLSIAKKCFSNVNFNASDMFSMVVIMDGLNYEHVVNKIKIFF